MKVRVFLSAIYVTNVWHLPLKQPSENHLDFIIYILSLLFSVD